MSYLPRTGLPIVEPSIRPNMQLDARQRAILQTVWSLNIVEREWLDKDGYFLLKSNANSILSNMQSSDREVSYNLIFHEFKYRIFCHYTTSLDYLDGLAGPEPVVISIRKRHNCGVFYAMLKLAGEKDQLDKMQTFPEQE